jgi:hypothetical protein
VKKNEKKRKLEELESEEEIKESYKTQMNLNKKINKGSTAKVKEEDIEIDTASGQQQV